MSTGKSGSSLLTYTTEKIPLYRFVFTPNRYFNMEVKTCTAAAVVKPRTRGSVRYMATNPNLQTPRQNFFFFLNDKETKKSHDRAGGEKPTENTQKLFPDHFLTLQSCLCSS